MSAVGLSVGTLMEPGEGANPHVEVRRAHPIEADAMRGRDGSAARLTPLG
jgi:hypothetical protein